MNTITKNLRPSGVLSGIGTIVFIVGLTGCSVNRVGLVGNPAIRRHFAQGQVTDVTISLKQVGENNGITGRRPVNQSFLEGFIEGALTEWDGTPAAGVAVRLAWEGWANPSPTTADEDDRPEPGQPLAPSLTPDEADPRASVLLDARGGTAITEKDGRYRVPFALPLHKGKVEAAGRLFFSPDWGVQIEKIGQAYEPYTEEVPLQLFYYHREKILAFNEGYHLEAVRLRRASLSEPTPASTSKSKGRDKSVLNNFWLDLQLTLVNHRLEKQVLLSKSENAVLLALPETTLFSENMSALTPSGLDLMKPIAQWMTNKRCRLSIQANPGKNPSLAARRAQEIKNALIQHGVPQARFILDADRPSSTGLTLCLYP